MITVRNLNLGNHHFVYRVGGEGPDVLLLHGWISSSRMWENVMPALAAHFRVWALDLIGFGDSRTSDDALELSVNAHAALVAEFCQHMDIQPHTVIGHSMGGSIALTLALDYPHLMQRLVLVCPVVTGTLHLNMASVLSQPFVRRVAAAGERWWPTLKSVPGVNLFIAPPYLSAEVNRRSLEEFQKASWRATHDGLASLLHIHLEDRLSAMTIPTLIITGSQDLTVPPADSRIAAQRIPNSTLLELSRCHHQPSDEEPELFNRTVLNFLQQPIANPQSA
jgi:pimeloyl-ACP methyl ester carboxylesterase